MFGTVYRYQGGVLSKVKVLQVPPVAYATDRSKAVVLVWLLVYVALLFLLRGVSCWVMLFSLSSCVFNPVKYCDHLVCMRGSWSTCFSCICLFILHKSISVLLVLPFRARNWLRLVIVALPGPFYFFLTDSSNAFYVYYYVSDNGNSIDFVTDQFINSSSWNFFFFFFFFGRLLLPLPPLVL